MKKKLFIKNTCSMTALCMGLFAFTGCSSNFFDSSIGPNGEKLVFDNNINQKQNAKPQAQSSRQNQKPQQTANNTQSTAIPHKDAGKQNESAASAGVIKPYVPDENTSASAMIEGAKQDLEQKLPEAFVPAAAPAASDTTTVAAASQAVNEPAVTDPVVEIINASNDQNVAMLSENKGRCGTLNAANSQDVTYKVALQQSKRLVSETGPVYIARTIIPDDLSDCVSDMSGVIDQALSRAGIQTIEGAAVNVTQNSGSSSIIPALVKACKQTGIPLLNVSLVRKIGTKTVITIRNIRVKDGITLVQNTTQL